MTINLSIVSMRYNSEIDVAIEIFVITVAQRVPFFLEGWKSFCHPTFQDDQLIRMPFHRLMPIGVELMPLSYLS